MNCMTPHLTWPQYFQYVIRLKYIQKYVTSYTIHTLAGPALFCFRLWIWNVSVILHWLFTMEAIQVFFICLLFCIRFLSLSLFFMIWSYLRNKSLNMQTLKDEMIKEVIWSSLPMTIGNDLVCIGIGPIPKVMAIFIIYTRNVMAVYFFLQIFVAVMVKYGIIFYGSYIALIEDRAIVKFSRITCSVGAILFNVGHLVEAVDVTKTSNFLALTTDNIWTDFVLH